MITPEHVVRLVATSTILDRHLRALDDWCKHMHQRPVPAAHVLDCVRRHPENIRNLMSYMGSGTAPLYHAITSSILGKGIPFHPALMDIPERKAP